MILRPPLSTLLPYTTLYRSGIARRIDLLDEIADPVAVDGVAEADLGGDLVALGHRDIAHIVAETGELRALEVVPAAGRSEEHTLNSSHANISYAVFCLKKNT